VINRKETELEPEPQFVISAPVPDPEANKFRLLGSRLRLHKTATVPTWLKCPESNDVGVGEIAKDFCLPLKPL
jgi:hypothetical protein